MSAPGDATVRGWLREDLLAQRQATPAEIGRIATSNPSQ
jgi:hypothetical protein